MMRGLGGGDAKQRGDGKKAHLLQFGMTMQEPAPGNLMGSAEPPAPPSA